MGPSSFPENEAGARGERVIKVLMIAPVPPPLTGQSLANQVVLEALVADPTFAVSVIDMAKPNSDAGPIGKLRRGLEVLVLLRGIRAKAREADVVYFNLSESRQGTSKDLLIYLLSRSHLDKYVVHLHGGQGMKRILSRDHRLLYWLNRLAYASIRRVIVLGHRHASTYSFLADQQKLAVIPNFAQDRYFITDQELEAKFADVQQVNILYLSSLISGKGYEELLTVALQFHAEGRRDVSFHFAGSFDDDTRQRNFIDRIAGVGTITYHGFAAGAKKQRLLAEAHIFCLPTYYAYEGQPISILEAYASGCAVVTTDHSGNFDIFTPGVNGLEVAPRSVPSLHTVLGAFASDMASCVKYGRQNLAVARTSYTTDIFVERVRECLR